MVLEFLEFLKLFWTFLILKFRILDSHCLGYNISDDPCLELLLVMKYYCNSAQGKLDNRSSHQVTVTGCHFQCCHICWMPFDPLLITFPYSGMNDPG